MDGIPRLKLFSQNVNKSLAATMVLKRRVTDTPTVLSIQEPNIAGGCIRGMGGLDYVTSGTDQSEGPCRCNVVCAYNDKVKLQHKQQLDSKSSISVLKATPGKLAVTCVYWNLKDNIADEIQHMRQVCSRFSREPWIMVGDTNCRHVLWGDRASDERGRQLAAAIKDLGLLVAQNKLPTFVGPAGQSSPDVLVMNREAVECITDYGVYCDENLSDHLLI